MSIRSEIAKQFANPRGLLGGLVGIVMANRPSNRRRYRWTIGCLDIAPDDRVLEIGCGPGLGIAGIAARLETGRVVGVDHSAVMIDQALCRNRAALRSGKAELIVRDIDDLPEIAGGFTKVMVVNVLQFVPGLDIAANRIADIMAPGGLLAATYQPRRRRPTREAAIAFGDRLAIAFGHAGFVDIRMMEMPEGTAPVITVLAVKPKS
ncbi:MAG: class I SAM-dependent methyltransferase [Alphaproteobacteria bacterium]|nr:class I SAM-dependent methyltransferase [Alphaproteobacteria bacterium]